MPSVPAAAAASCLPFARAKCPDVLALATRLTGVPPVEVERLAQLLLHHPPFDAVEREGRSDLSVNGCPLQLLVSVREGRVAGRLIGDPAFWEADPGVRLGRSLAALAATLVSTHAAGLMDLVHRSLDETVPTTAAARAGYPTGMLRLATALRQDGAAVYAGSVADPDQARRRACAWARTILPDPAAALELLAELRSRARIFGVGIEGTGAENARAKLYWKPADPAAPRADGPAAFRAGSIGSFLDGVLAGRTVPPGAVTFSTAFRVDTGEVADWKADVCTRATGLDAARTACRVAEDAAAMAALPCPPAVLDALREHPAVRLGVVGLGEDARGARRLNLYLYQDEPPCP
jgi:hypothetical protein